MRSATDANAGRRSHSLPARFYASAPKTRARRNLRQAFWLKIGATAASARLRNALFPEEHFTMERTVHKARTFEAAADWDRRQHVQLSPQERLRAARMLKRRAFPADVPDVRACHRTE